MIQPDWQSDDGAIQLYCGDCLKILPELPKVDAVVTDPPYNIKVGAAFVRNNCKIVSDGNEAMNVGDTWAWCNHLDCLRDGGNVASFHRQGESLPSPLISWHRFYLVKQAPPPTPRPVFVSAVEECSIGRKPGRSRWFGGGYAPNYWVGMTPNRLKRGSGHDAEKPIEPIVMLITSLSDDGETVLDPFMGSGTTGVACVKTGRKFIGIEIHRPYFDIAVKRIEAAIRERSEKLVYA